MGHRLGMPVILRRFLVWLEEEDAGSQHEAWLGWVWALLLGLLAFTTAINSNQLTWVARVSAWRMRQQVVAAMHAKLLRLSALAVGAMSLGRVVTMVSNDVQRLDDAIPFWVYVWAGPLETLMVLIMVGVQLNWQSAAAGVAVSLALIPLQTALVKYVGQLRKETAKATDERVKLVSEAVQSALPIKMLSCEASFEAQIAAKRAEEARFIRRLAAVRGLNTTLSFSSGPVVAFVTFNVFRATQGMMDVPTVFFALSLLALLRTSMFELFVTGAQRLTELRISLQRIDAFLSLPEPRCIVYTEDSAFDVAVQQQQQAAAQLDRLKTGRRSASTAAAAAAAVAGGGAAATDGHVIVGLPSVDEGPFVRGSTASAHGLRSTSAIQLDLNAGGPSRRISANSNGSGTIVRGQPAQPARPRIASWRLKPPGYVSMTPADFGWPQQLTPVAADIGGGAQAPTISQRALSGLPRLRARLRTKSETGSGAVSASALSRGSALLTAQSVKNVLSGIAFEAQPSSLFAVVGGCGSGKSSLLAAMLGELQPMVPGAGGAPRTVSAAGAGALSTAPSRVRMSAPPSPTGKKETAGAPPPHPFSPHALTWPGKGPAAVAAAVPPAAAVATVTALLPSAAPANIHALATVGENEEGVDGAGAGGGAGGKPALPVSVSASDAAAESDKGDRGQVVSWPKAPPPLLQRAAAKGRDSGRDRDDDDEDEVLAGRRSPAAPSPTLTPAPALGTSSVRSQQHVDGSVKGPPHGTADAASSIGDEARGAVAAAAGSRALFRRLTSKYREVTSQISGISPRAASVAILTADLEAATAAGATAPPKPPAAAGAAGSSTISYSSSVLSPRALLRRFTSLRRTTRSMAEEDEEPRPPGPLMVGRVAYCSQVPWVTAGTVRDNILFGLPYEEEWYGQVVAACCLEEDLANLPAGDMTELGEKGTNLSGGQRARIALARACYCRPDVALLDDPLSAVDPRVSRLLFERVLGPMGILATECGATRILTTHHAHVLPLCDQVLVLRNGACAAIGSWHEVSALGLPEVPAQLPRLPSLPSHITETGSGEGTDTESAASSGGRRGHSSSGAHHGIGDAASAAPAATPPPSVQRAGTGRRVHLLPPARRSASGAASRFGATTTMAASPSPALHDGSSRLTPLDPDEPPATTTTIASYPTRPSSASGSSAHGGTLYPPSAFAQLPAVRCTSQPGTGAAASSPHTPAQPSVRAPGPGPASLMPTPFVRSLNGTASSVAGPEGYATPTHANANANASTHAGSSLSGGNAASPTAAGAAASSAFGSPRAQRQAARASSPHGVIMQAASRMRQMPKLPPIPSARWGEVAETAASGRFTAPSLSGASSITLAPPAAANPSASAAGGARATWGRRFSVAIGRRLTARFGSAVGGASIRMGSLRLSTGAMGSGRTSGGGGRSSTLRSSSSMGKLTVGEDRETGAVTWAVYGAYCRHGGVLLITFGLLAMAAGQAIWMYSDWWLARWARQDEQGQEEAIWPAVYAGLVGGVVVLGGARTLALFEAMLTAATSLNAAMTHCVLRAPLAFFHTNPTGRIVNRFSKDQGTVDDQLPTRMFYTLQSGLIVIGTVIIVAIALPLVLPAFVPLFVLFIYIRQRYVAAGRQVKRNEAISRSPMLAAFQAVLGGLTTIRAYGAAPQMKYHAHFLDRLAVNGAWSFAQIATDRWTALRVGFVSAGALLASALLAVVLRGKVSTTLLALALTNILSLAEKMQWVVRQTAEAETCMTSVERMLAYTELPSEPPCCAEGGGEPPLGWPRSGALSFLGVTAIYRPGLPPVLDDVTFTLPAGSTCGVVGRTGSGKSSLALALFRFIDVTSGTILLDGLDTASVGLDALRRQLAIIPQDPVLFSGTLRSNLDPWDMHSDAAVWQVLESVRLKAAVLDMPGGLDARVAEGGANISAGQRQLVSLARALLQDVSVLVLDEATANVDSETDALIQEVLRGFACEGKERRDRVLLTIAHRINTVMECDSLLVLASGKLVEWGVPRELAEQAGGVFASMVEAAARNA